MKTLGPIVLVLAAAGCRVVEVNPPPLWKAPQVERWRLTEREYGAIPDPWAQAGDGELPATSQAMLYEPVFRVEAKPGAPAVLPSISPCLHRIRLRRETPEGMGVGETAEIHLTVECSPNAAHVVRIAGAHQGIRIKDVRGASPLTGCPECYAVSGAAKVEVRFTSTIAGRAGLEVELLGETSAALVPAPPESLAERR